MPQTIIQRLINLEKLVKDIKLLIEQRILNGLALEDAMDGLYRDLRAKEMRRKDDPNAIEPGVKYPLPSFPLTLEPTFSDTTLEPTSPQSGFRTPSEDRGAAAVRGRIEHTAPLTHAAWDVEADLGRHGRMLGGSKRRKKKGKKRRTNRR